MIRNAHTIEGVTYAPGARFRVVKEGARLSGWVPIRGGSRGWRQDLHVGDVIECTGFGRGMGSDPGYGVEFVSEESKAAGAFHVDFFPAAGGIWSYHPAEGFIEPEESP